MNRLEMEFDAFFKNKGGISHDVFSNIPLNQSFLVYARAEIELLRTKDANIPPIYVDLVDNPALNAVAGRSGNQYFIGIYIGAILQSFAIFSRMLSSNTILKNIGDPALEGPPQKMHDIQLKEVISPILSYKRSLLPNDPIRVATVKMFVKHVLDFLIFHEYAHIVHGHLDYCNTISDQSPTSVDPLIFQTLEVSADSFSTIMNLFLLYKGVPEKNHIITEELQSYYRDRDTALKMWLFPIYTYFRLFGHTNLRHCITSDKHPAPGCRANLIMDEVLFFMDYTFGNAAVDPLAERCIDIIIEVEEAFAEVSEQGLDARTIRSSFSDEMMNHTRNLFAKQSEIDELLKEYSYIPRY
jgi:hypothetical protein